MIEYLSDGTPVASFGYEEDGPWQRAAQIGAAYNAQRFGGPMAAPQQQLRGPAGPYDNVYTGHATERMPENNPMVQNAMMAAQQMLRNAPAGYARYGDTVRSGGQQYSYADLVKQAGGEDHALDQFTTAPNRPMADRVAQLMQARDTDPRFRNLSGVEFNQAFTSAVGADPFSYQDRQQKQAAAQFETAMKLQQMDAQQRKALMDEYDFHAKAMGGRPEDIMVSYGRNAAPNHQNEFYIPAHQGMTEAGEPPREVPGEWRGGDPGTVERMRQIRSALGIHTMPTLDEVHAMIAEKERALPRKGMGDIRFAERQRALYPYEQAEIDRSLRAMNWNWESAVP